jgi:hypothetical protein
MPKKEQKQKNVPSLDWHVFLRKTETPKAETFQSLALSFTSSFTSAFTSHPSIF